MPEATGADKVDQAEFELVRHGKGQAAGLSRAEVVLRDDPVGEVIRHAEEADLTIIGVQRETRRKKYFGRFAFEVVGRTQSAVMLISRRG
jgi:hypothetical protein